MILLLVLIAYCRSMHQPHDMVARRQSWEACHLLVQSKWGSPQILNFNHLSCFCSSFVINKKKTAKLPKYFSIFVSAKWEIPRSQILINYLYIRGLMYVAVALQSGRNKRFTRFLRAFFLSLCLCLSHISHKAIDSVKKRYDM